MSSGANDRPITDELVCLKQAVDLLKVAEDLVPTENIERYPGAIASGDRSDTFPKAQPQKKKERGPPEGLAPFSAVRSPAGEC